jgi:uncharacterized Zn-binding protein involved in type VI secretion
LPVLKDIPSLLNRSNSSEGRLRQNVPGVGEVTLELTYPAGKSPKVFTTGWVFGAIAMINAGKKDQKDISDTVQWSGSGSFSPATGRISHPSFSSEGGNTINLSVKVGDKTLRQEYQVVTVSSATYASVSAVAVCNGDAHGCSMCPHEVQGLVNQGSPNVLVRGKPAARVGDTGTHFLTCCGPNTFEIVTGDPLVLIDGKQAAMVKLSKTRHCGGTGVLDAADLGGKTLARLLFENAQFMQNSGNAANKANTFIKLFLQPVFSGVAFSVDNNLVNSNQTIPINFTKSGDTVTGNAEVKLTGQLSSKTLKGRFNMDYSFKVQSKDKTVPITMTYSGDFVSKTEIPDKPAGDTIEILFTGDVKSRDLYNYIYGMAVAMGQSFGGEGTVQTNKPDTDVLARDYPSEVSFNVGLPQKSGPR